MAQAKYMPGSRGITVGDDALGALVTALYDIANQARRAAAGDPVEPAGVRVLVWVQALGSPRPSELATKLRLDLSTVSRHVRALSADGYLAVAPDAEDGRAQRITLTDQGHEAIKSVVANRREALGAVFSRWPADDQTQLTTLMRRLADEMADQDQEVHA
jgi:DNA-binding MarR family transcriptional regulator